MSTQDAFKGLSLVDFNVGAAGAVLLINPLAAQLDALLTVGLGLYQSDVLARLNAALAAQASLSLAISPFTIGAQLNASLAAMAQLRAALALGLGLPNIALSANLSITAALKIELGAIRALIQAALAVKLPAVTVAASLSAALSAGPFYVLTFSESALSAVGSHINAKAQAGFSGAEAGLSSPAQDILPTDQVFGILIVCKDPALMASFGAIISVP
jgi:hypothetical protein